MKNRIKKLREELGFTQEDIATMLVTNPRVIGFYETDIREFSLVYACKFADIFGCSVDYLIERTDTRTHDIKIHQEYLSLVEECIKYNIPPKQFARIVDLLKELTPENFC